MTADLFHFPWLPKPQPDPAPSIDPSTIAYETAAARATGTNARQMVLNDRERFTSLEQLATAYQEALATSLQDRAALRERVDALSGRVAALEKLQLRGTTATGATTASLLAGRNSTVTVNLKTEMPDANYLAFPTLDGTTGVALGAVTLTVTAKTTKTVTVQVQNSGVGVLQTVAFTVLAITLS